MNGKELDLFLASNTDLAIEAVAIFEKDGEWCMTIGHTHLDGVFRHIDFIITDKFGDDIAAAKHILKQMEPAGVYPVTKSYRFRDAMLEKNSKNEE